MHDHRKFEGFYSYQNNSSIIRINMSGNESFSLNITRHASFVPKKIDLLYENRKVISKYVFECQIGSLCRNVRLRGTLVRKCKKISEIVCLNNFDALCSIKHRKLCADFEMKVNGDQLTMHVMHFKIFCTLTIKHVNIVSTVHLIWREINRFLPSRP